MSSGINYRKGHTKKEKMIQKEKLKARLEFGPKSGRSSKNYQRKKKNKYLDEKT